MTQPPQNHAYGDQPWSSPPVAQEVPAGLAGRGARLLAAIIDMVFLVTVGLLAVLPFVGADGFFGKADTDAENVSVFVSIGPGAGNFAIIGIAFFYFWLMHAKWGQTLGKKALGIRVVRAEDGGPITSGQAAGRAAFYQVLGGLIGCVGLVDVLWCLWDERKQCLHDKVAKTLVIKVDG